MWQTHTNFTPDLSQKQLICLYFSWFKVQDMRALYIISPGSSHKTVIQPHTDVVIPHLTQIKRQESKHCVFLCVDVLYYIAQYRAVMNLLKYSTFLVLLLI